MLAEKVKTRSNEYCSRRLNTDTTAYYEYYIIGGKKYLSHQLVYIMFKNELLPQP